MTGPSIKDELKKKQPFSSPEQEALLALWRTSDQLALRFARLFREHGLTPAQYNVLRILRGAGEPLPCLEIANRLITQVPGITGLIDRLEAQGLVTRHRSLEDRRVILIQIHPDAIRQLQTLDEPVDALHHQLLGHLTPQELATLIQLLDKTRQELPSQIS